MLTAIGFAALAVLIRVPMLYNADALFGDDEAANALSIKHLVEGRAILLFYYGQRYQGIVEGLAALPLVALFGWRALPFVCSPLIAWIGTAIIVGHWFWYRWSPRWACVWFLLQLPVPVFVLWASTQAHGGHVWVVFFAVVAFWLADRYRTEPTRGGARFALTQFLGAYTYSYYALFLPLTAATWLLARGGRSARCWGVAVGSGVLALAVVVGLRAAADRIQPDRNHYPDFWRLDQQVTRVGLADRWWVLRKQCLPLALSLESVCNEYARFHASLWGMAVGRDQMPQPLEWFGRWFALMQLAVVGGACLVLLARPVRSIQQCLVPAAVCAAGVLACAAFVAFRYGEQWSRVRYLVPVYPAIAMAAVLCAREVFERARGAARLVCAVAAACVFAAWVGYYGWLDWAYYRTQGMVDASGRVRAITSPPLELARWCEQRGLTGMVGYADYRLAFPVAWLTEERVRFCPWDLRRIPSYAQEAARLKLPWYAGFELGSTGGRPPVPGLRYELAVRLPAGPFAAVLWRPVLADVSRSSTQKTGPPHSPRPESESVDRYRTGPSRR